jgi:hypothetical protein
VKDVPAWLPGAGFQRMAQDILAMQRRALDDPINVVKTQMVSFRRS